MLVEVDSSEGHRYPS